MMAASERRGINDHLVRHSGRLAGGIKQVFREVRNDHDIPRRIGANRHGPHDLVEIERVDVGINDDYKLGIAEPVRRC